MQRMGKNLATLTEFPWGNIVLLFHNMTMVKWVERVSSILSLFIRQDAYDTNIVEVKH